MRYLTALPVSCFAFNVQYRNGRDQKSIDRHGVFHHLGSQLLGSCGTKREYRQHPNFPAHTKSVYFLIQISMLTDSDLKNNAN